MADGPFQPGDTYHPTCGLRIIPEGLKRLSGMVQ
jgi:hypothetical protein